MKHFLYLILLCVISYSWFYLSYFEKTLDNLDVLEKIRIENVYFIGCAENTKQFAICHEKAQKFSEGF